jgi:hypothetical protein
MVVRFIVPLYSHCFACFTDQYNIHLILSSYILLYNVKAEGEETEAIVTTDAKSELNL